MLKRQPPREILHRYQRESGVSWQAVDRQTVKEITDLLVRAGVVFSEGMALLDLHYAIAAQEVESYRHYAGRWRWGAKSVYNLFVKVGIYPPAASNIGAPKRSGTRNKKPGATREQSRSSKGATGEQKPGKSSKNPPGRKQTGAGGEQKGASREPSSVSISGSVSESGGKRNVSHRQAGGARRRPPKSEREILEEIDRSASLVRELFSDRR